MDPLFIFGIGPFLQLGARNRQTGARLYVIYVPAGG